MNRRLALALLLGAPRANDLQICGPLTREKPYLKFDLNLWAGVKVIGPDRREVEMPVDVIWEELVK